ncbi:hypothetical protein SDC9_190067 [bioreactor metagenome]|uniref:Uncharacterized protein n=1 Tax=bioreactor metagenome TaxID=1076179 RepID=A0A645HUH0_9ZZZZ
MLQLAGRVHRVAIHHDTAGTQGAEHADGVLQEIRQHDRHARTTRQFQYRLQVGGEPARGFVQLAVGQRGAHVEVGHALAETRHAAFEQIDQRPILALIDLRWDAGRVALQPDFFHHSTSISVASANSSAARTGICGKTRTTAAR